MPVLSDPATVLHQIHSTSHWIPGHYCSVCVVNQEKLGWLEGTVRHLWVQPCLVDIDDVTVPNVRLELDPCSWDHQACSCPSRTLRGVLCSSSGSHSVNPDPVIKSWLWVHSSRISERSSGQEQERFHSTSLVCFKMAAYCLLNGWLLFTATGLNTTDSWHVASYHPDLTESITKTCTKAGGGWGVYKSSNKYLSESSEVESARRMKSRGSRTSHLK